MSTLVVLATAAAGAGALGFVLTALTGRRRSRHRGGATATARAGAAALALAVAALALTPLLDAVELGLSAIALWWASLPWLALTARLSGVGARRLGPRRQRSVQQGCCTWPGSRPHRGSRRLRRSGPGCSGQWPAWPPCSSWASCARRRPSRDRRRRLAPRPAFSVLWAAGAVAAASLAVLVHDRPAPAPTQTATPATRSSTTAATSAAGPTSSNAPPPRPTPSRTEGRGAATSRPAPRPATTTAAARGATRTATPLPTRTSLPPTEHHDVDDRPGAGHQDPAHAPEPSAHPARPAVGSR